MTNSGTRKVQPIDLATWGLPHLANWPDDCGAFVRETVACTRKLTPRDFPPRDHKSSTTTHAIRLTINAISTRTTSVLDAVRHSPHSHASERHASSDAKTITKDSAPRAEYRIPLNPPTVPQADRTATQAPPINCRSIWPATATPAQSLTTAHAIIKHHTRP